MPVPTIPCSTDSPPPASPAPCRHPHKKKARHHSKVTAASSTTYVDLGSQLRRAAGAGKSRLLARLLRSGADPNEATSEGDTALMAACVGPTTDGKMGVIESLLASGADVNAANSGGETALMVAAKEGDMMAVEALLLAEADVRREDRNCDTALCHATQQGSEEVVRALVTATRAAGCDIDHRNIKGLTPLILASQNGRLGVARILVSEGGASPSIRDLDNFMTPLDWLRQGGQYLESEVAFLLPASKKRSRYHQTKRVQTLTDYMPGGTGGSPRNTFTVSSGRCSTPRLPKISTFLSPSPQTMLNRTCSMFDFPPSNTPPQIKKLLPPRPLKNVDSKTENRFDCDLYQSTYLKKRNHYLHRNHRSEFYHEGSLKPISGGHLEQSDQDTDKREEGQRRGGGGGGGRGGRGGGGGGRGGGGGEEVKGRKFHSLPPI